MKKHRFKMSLKGFTLVEIILSLAIFAIISVGFYSLFTIVYINTYKTSQVTEATFLAQRELEDEIADIKEKIINNETITGYTLEDYTLFSGTEERTIQGYHLTNVGTSSTSLESLVSEIRPPGLQVPTLYPFTIMATDIEGGLTVEKKYPTIDMTSLTLDIDGNLSTSNDGLLISYLYYWYISDDMGYIPHDEPAFPDDYALIPGETTRSLTNIPIEYAGRYFKLVVTPVGEKGRMGEAVLSNTIYVSQFNKTEDLILRLDGSYINPDDTDQVNQSGTDSYIKRWLSVFPEDMRNVSSSMNTPLLKSYTITGNTISNKINAVTSDNGNTRVIETGSDSSLRSNLNTTVYLTLRLSAGLNDTVEILQTESYDSNGWWFRYNTNNNRLIMRHYINSTNRQAHINLDNVPEIERDTWLFIKLDVWDDMVAIDINGIAKEVTTYSSTTSYHTTPLTIRVNDMLNIGDILIYDARHTDEDRDEVFAYFNAKYYPEE